MVQPHRRVSACLVQLALLAFLTSTSGKAQTEIIDSQFSTCGTVRCDITSIASWVGNAARKTLPWTAKFFASGGNCLRLDVSFIRTSANLEMTVIGPNALSAYRNDQGGTACTNCPLVKIDPAPATGYYTAVISTNNGALPDTDFHILFGQYQHGNINCTNPTPPLP